ITLLSLRRRSGPPRLGLLLLLQLAFGGPLGGGDNRLLGFVEFLVRHFPAAVQRPQVRQAEPAGRRRVLLRQPPLDQRSGDEPDQDQPDQDQRPPDHIALRHVRSLSPPLLCHQRYAPVSARVERRAEPSPRQTVPFPTPFDL